MDANNSINNFLTSLFQDVSINGVHDGNKYQIEQFFITILDTPYQEAFNSPLLYQMLLLLEREPSTNKILSLLIEEVKLKGLRVAFMPKDNAIQSTVSSCDDNCKQPQPQMQRKQMIKKTVPQETKDIYNAISNGLLSRIYWEKDDDSSCDNGVEEAIF